MPNVSDVEVAEVHSEEAGVAALDATVERGEPILQVRKPGQHFPLTQGSCSNARSAR